MINKIALTIFIFFFLLSFCIPELWSIATLLFSFGVIEFYYEKKTIQIIRK